MLVDVQLAANYLRYIDYIGVSAFPVGRAVYNEFSGSAVDEYSRSLAVKMRGMKITKIAFIFLTISKLRLYIFNGRMAAVIEEGRKLAGAVLAEIAVIKLAVTEKSYLFAADITKFLIE